MHSRRFPEFGSELDRGFPVHETCYDCVEFYVSCGAWPADKPFRCADYYPLPDVMPGTSGQVFPPSRMQGRKEPRVRRDPTAEQDGSQPRRAVSEKRRKYMTNYMRRRRAAQPQPKQVSDVPSALPTRPSIGPPIENVNTPHLRGRVPVCKQNLY